MKNISAIVSESVDKVFEEREPLSTAELQKILDGLRVVRDMYERGSSVRHIYSSACHRLKKLIEKQTAQSSQ